MDAGQFSPFASRIRAASMAVPPSRHLRYAEVRARHHRAASGADILNRNTVPAALAVAANRGPGQIAGEIK